MAIKTQDIRKEIESARLRIQLLLSTATEKEWAVKTNDEKWDVTFTCIHTDILKTRYIRLERYKDWRECANQHAEEIYMIYTRRAWREAIKTVDDLGGR